MAIINWTEEYSVGVKELDHQHQNLIAIINRLYALYKDNKFSKTDAAPIFKELFDYADYHFGTEEHYFQIYNYPKKDEHINIHNQYRDKMEAFKDRYDAGPSPEVLFEISNFLNEWWIWHINNTDREYTKYFNANGLM